MKPSLPIFLLWLCIISIAFSQKEIDTFNILFPEAYKQSSGKSIELVRTEGGCFDWTSSSPEVVSVTGLAEDQTNCYRKGLVSLKHVGSYPASVYITATNTQTQELSNIPVRIRSIVKIQIIAKSKLMNINEIQKLSIFAYDKDQNMFTSLEGIKFEWQLVQNQKVLSKISLKNSHLILPLDERKNIEMRGAESDILVIKGDSPGKVVIRVKCIEPGYQHLNHQINVSVQQRFEIDPSLPTYIMVNSTFTFNLLTPSRQQIALPKSYYKTSLTSPKFKISDSLEILSPLSEDQTVLKVEDIRTSPSFSTDVTIFAKQPNAIVLNVDEYLIVGEESKVNVQFWWDKHILNGKNSNFIIKTELPFDTHKQTIIGKQRTTATIKAIYKYLSTQKKVTVVLPLKEVLPSKKIVLPIDQTFQLKVIGGSGLYEYQIQGDIAGISGSGVISSRKQGHGKVVVIDKKVPRNKLVLDLIVSPISSIVPLEAHKQLNVNEFGPVFTIGKGKNYEQFTKCNEQNIVLETSHLQSFETSTNSSFSSSMDFLNGKIAQSSVVKTNLMKNALLPLGVEDFVSKFSTYIKAGDASTEQLRRYIRDLQNYGICSAHWVKSYQKYDAHMDVYLRKNVNVRNKFSLRVYDKISNSLNKQKGDSFVLTPLASLNWKTTGGSQSWNSKTRTLLNSVQYHTQQPTVRCPDKETALQMKMVRSNVESQQLLFPVNQSKTIYVQCKYPSQLKIKYKKETLDSHTINGIVDQIIQGQLIPLDNKGQTFYNSSNLIYQFERTAGSVEIANDHFEFDSEEAKSAKVTFWTEKIAGVKSSFSKVSSYFTYTAHKMFQIEPHPERDHQMMLFNPKTSYNFKLKRISENGEVECSGSISCSYLGSIKEIKVNTTRLGSGSLKIIDRSLYNYPSLTITFDVIDADEIVLFINNGTVEVQKKVSAEVRLLYQQKVIPTWQYDFRNFLIVHQAGIRSRQVQSTQTSTSSNLYQISTQKPGTYKITAEQHYPRYLESQPVTLKVYPKFETNIPSLDQSYTKDDILQLKGQLTVAVNCVRKIQLSGGPDSINVDHKTDDGKHLEVRFTNPESKEIQIVGLQKGTTRVLLTVTSSVQNGLKVALLELHVTVKPIDHATIYSLEDAILNAQFRVIPYLVVDGRPMIDSVCDFEYKWTTDQHIKLQGLNNRRLGVNATAVKQGDALIKLEVLKDGKVLFSSTKEITVHKSLDIELPTIIGQRQNAISTNLLLPPNSGLNFDSNIFVTKMSECDQNMLSINQNKLVTSRQKGMVSIKLQKTNDNSYNNYMNVIVTEIKALFLENSYSQVSAEVGKITPVKFYVQDMYGRLFYNNLFNVEYDVISSNQDIFTASVDSSKNFINIHSKRQGSAQLIIRLKSSEGSSNLGKLLQIPHDIVSVEVGKVIEPQSPIYLAVGGQVHIQYHGKANQKWIVLNGGNLIEIDPRTNKITGVQVGEAVVSIGGSEVIVRILDVIIKSKIVSSPAPGKAQLITQHIATGKWLDEEIFFQSIQNTYNYINNNLNLTCASPDLRWLTPTSQIIKTDTIDKLRCQVSMNYDMKLEDMMPESIEIQIIQIDKDNVKSRLHTIREKIHSTFWIPKLYRVLLLSPQKPLAQFFIKTPHKLQIEVIGAEQSWLRQHFEASKSTLALSLAVDSSLSQNTEFKLRVTNLQTQQTEDIIVKYIIDESTLKAEQKSHQPKETYHETPAQTSRQSESGGVMQLFMGWHWTDFIILIMAINFIAILIYQACVNGGSHEHTL